MAISVAISYALIVLFEVSNIFQPRLCFIFIMLSSFLTPAQLTIIILCCSTRLLWFTWRKFSSTSWAWGSYRLWGESRLNRIDYNCKYKYNCEQTILKQSIYNLREHPLLAFKQLTQQRNIYWTIWTFSEKQNHALPSVWAKWKKPVTPQLKLKKKWQEQHG